MRRRAFSLIELLITIAIVAVLGVCLSAAARQALFSSSLASSAGNIRQLAAGSAAYLAENNYTFWSYRSTDSDRPGVVWWFGYEPKSSLAKAEGERFVDPAAGPLGEYVPGGFRPDPSFRNGGNAFKPKYRFGYIGTGYNVLLGGGWLGIAERKKYWDLPSPGEIVVFATSAQVNNFQKPASAKNPMLEEFYGLDGSEVTVHFRHHGNAMVAFASGSAGFLPIDPSTLDTRAPKANVGRFAPKGSTKYLLPEVTP